MNAAERDAQIMQEAADQRAHDRELAEIDRLTRQEAQRQETIRRETRYQMFIWIIIIVAVASALIVLIDAISDATSEDRAKEIKFREQQGAVAETCIRNGNIWLDGDCIPANRTTP